MKNKNLLTLSFIALLFLVPISASAGLVPCANSENPEPCTLCHFIVGFWNLIDYGFKILVFVALTGLVIAGIMYIVSAGSEELIKTAKTFIRQVLTGFAIILGAWLLIFVVMNYLGVKPDRGLGVEKEGWNKFTCDTESAPAAYAPSPDNTSSPNPLVNPPSPDDPWCRLVFSPKTIMEGGTAYAAWTSNDEDENIPFICTSNSSGMLKQTDNPLKLENPPAGTCTLTVEKQGKTAQCWATLTVLPVSPPDNHTCGNGTLEPPYEECDDNNTDNNDGCDSNCELEDAPPGSDCGNGTIEAGEECDDGNTTSGDGCSAGCEKEQVIPPGSINMGKDFYSTYPNVFKDNIPANGVKYYYFRLDKSVSNLGIVTASLDWVTDQDFIVSKKQQPAKEIYDQVKNSGTNSRNPSATYWYNFNKGTLEQLELTNVSGNAGDIFFVTVFNVSDQQGQYQLYWYPY